MGWSQNLPRCQSAHNGRKCSRADGHSGAHHSISDGSLPGDLYWPADDAEDLSDEMTSTLLIQLGIASVDINAGRRDHEFISDYLNVCREIDRRIPRPPKE